MGKVVNNTSLTYRHKTEHPLIEHSFEITVSKNIELPWCTSGKQLPWKYFLRSNHEGTEMTLQQWSKGARLHLKQQQQQQQNVPSSYDALCVGIQNTRERESWRLVLGFQKKAGDTR